MDARALALSMEDARSSDGTISLRELQERLHRTGQDELARAVGSLAGRMTSSRMELDAPVAPWF